MSGAQIRGYIELTRPRITWLILLSTALGYFFGLPAHNWRDCLARFLAWRTFNTLFGTALMASGTAALNEWYERDADRRMRRTARRPLPSGTLKPASALLFGAAISLAGFAELALAVNVCAASLGALTLLLYLGVYTPLKSRSWLCTTAGAFPGALPPAIGFAAAHGSLNTEGLILSAILFVWQFPHFYAIAWMCREDYGRAAIKMLPVVEPDGVSTARQMVLYGAALLPVSMLPGLAGMDGFVYGAAAALLGCWLLQRIVRTANAGLAHARGVLIASVIYLPVLYTAMVLDRIWL